MKTKFQVFTLTEKEIITHASLGSDGLTIETEFATISALEFECDTELECIERLQEWESTHEIEIKKVFVTGIKK